MLLTRHFEAEDRLRELEARGHRFTKIGRAPAVFDHSTRFSFAAPGFTSITWPANENQTSAPWPNIIIRGDTALVGAVLQRQDEFVVIRTIVLDARAVNQSAPSGPVHMNTGRNRSSVEPRIT